MSNTHTDKLKGIPVEILNFDTTNGTKYTPSITATLNIDNSVIREISQTKISSTQHTPAYFVTPGFINAHAHWLMLGGSSLREAVDLIEKNPEEMKQRALINAQKTAQMGITTVCDKGPPGRKNAPQILNQIKEYFHENNPNNPNNDNNGRNVIPRTFASHWTISCPGGFADVFLQAVSTKQELLSKLEELRTSGSELIKFILETELDANYEYKVVVSDELLSAAVDFARTHNMRVSAHAKGTLGIDACLRHGIAGIEHALQATNAQIALLEERNIFVGLTLEGFECRIKHAVENREDTNTMRVVEYEWAAATRLATKLAHFHSDERNSNSTNGTNSTNSASNVLFASDAGSHSTPHASLRELMLMRKFGFSPTDIFRAATWNGARFLNQQNNIGKVARGYQADLIFWNTNPLLLSELEWERLNKHIAGVMVGERWAKLPSHLSSHY